MKLAIDCRLIGPTGIGVFIDNVLEYIVHDDSNTYVLIGNTEKLARYSHLPYCQIVESNLGSFSPKELLCFPIKEVNKCDAFYSPNFNLPMGLKVPVFSTIHDILFFETERFGSLIHRLALKWYVHRALKTSRSVFTVSNFSRTRIKNYFNTNADICVVHNGINKALKQYNYKNDGKRNGIVFLGSIKRHKGLHVLLKAYEKLQQSIDNCPPLNIIGHVDFRTKDNEILSLINKNIKGVNFMGAVDNETLYDVLSHSEVLVSPSFYEGFGIPPLEAMYLGTPSIISDIPVYKEVYSMLPVTFFKTGDADDLYSKLKAFKHQTLNLRQEIDAMYNYSETASNILSYIQGAINA